MVHDIHLKAPQNWINDPNGFIYYKGIYHLFYQHFPYEPRWGTMHWGHAVSKDMVSWEHKGIALFPTRYEDQNGCFSGSAVEKDGKMYLFYTGVRYEEVDPEDIHSCINDQFEAAQLMISSEDGCTFDNFHGKKVIIPAIEEWEMADTKHISDPKRRSSHLPAFQSQRKLGDRTHTRDPKVWRGKDAWYMVLGSMTKEEGGKLLFYKSDDLSEWTYVNQVSEEKRLGWMWECPDYFVTDGEKVLVFSPMGIMPDRRQWENQAICCCVSFDEGSCTMEIPEKYQFLDYGLDLYAPQSTVDEEGRRVIIGWMRMPEAVENKWNGMFCMPRIVEVKNGHVCFRLHPNLKKAFSRKIESVSEADEAGYSMHLDLQEGESVSVGGYRISRRDGKIHTDRSQVFGELKGCQMEFETPEIKEGFHLDIYVDKNLIEVYINDGEYVVSNVVYSLGQDIEADTEYTLFTVQ